LYIYWHIGELVVRAHRIPKSTTASGIILVGGNEIPATDGPAILPEVPADAAVPPGWKGIKFIMSESSAVTIKSFRDYYYSPRFEISNKLRLDSIYIGSERTHPTNHTFGLSLRDRHAMAWFDVDDDGATDAVIANGGQGGQIRGRVEEGSGSYEVLLKRAGRFQRRFDLRALCAEYFLRRVGEPPLRRAAPARGQCALARSVTLSAAGSFSAPRPSPGTLGLLEQRANDRGVRCLEGTPAPRWCGRR
jgi:hypothetical protein